MGHLVREVPRHIYSFVFTQLSELNGFQIQRARDRQAAYLQRYRTVEKRADAADGEAPGDNEVQSEPCQVDDEVQPRNVGQEEGSTGAAGGGSQTAQLDVVEALAPSADSANGGDDGLHARAKEEVDEELASSKALDAHLRALDVHIGSVVDAVAPNTLVLVVTGNGDTAECRRMQELKVMFKPLTSVTL